MKLILAALLRTQHQPSSKASNELGRLPAPFGVIQMSNYNKAMVDIDPDTNTVTRVVVPMFPNSFVIAAAGIYEEGRTPYVMDYETATDRFDSQEPLTEIAIQQLETLDLPNFLSHSQLMLQTSQEFLNEFNSARDKYLASQEGQHDESL